MSWRRTPTVPRMATLDGIRRSGYGLVVRLAHIVLVLSLILGMNSGLMEAFEDGVHLLVDGHTDHAEEEDACPEHGCTPTSHLCDCCHALSIANVSAAVVVLDSSATRHRWAQPAPDAAPRGVSRRLLRPPTA